VSRREVAKRLGERRLRERDVACDATSVATVRDAWRRAAALGTIRHSWRVGVTCRQIVVPWAT